MTLSELQCARAFIPPAANIWFASLCALCLHVVDHFSASLFFDIAAKVSYIFLPAGVFAVVSALPGDVIALAHLLLLIAPPIFKSFVNTHKLI